MSDSPYILPGHGWLPEPELSFHPERNEDKHFHPLKGLQHFGPYSRSLIGSVVDPLRVAAIYPNGWERQHAGILNELESRIEPNERYAYLPEYPGFSHLFGLRVVRAHEDVELELPSDVSERLRRADNASGELAEVITRAIGALSNRRSDFDVLMIYLPAQWSDFFFGSRGGDFNLHDYLKAVTADSQVPMQILTDWQNGALAYRNRASVMWRLGIALYTKAGGIPWRLADVDPETAFIGLSYSLGPSEKGDSPEFVTCCSQVFDADGAGLEFVAYETDDVSVQRKNPYLSRTEMRRVMSRSLNLYQRRHGGRTPRKIVVHKTSHFKSREIDGCFDAFERVDDVELIQVVRGIDWRGVKIEPGGRGGKGRASSYPVERGTFLCKSGDEVFVWTQGNVERALGKDFYKEGKSIPRPLLLRRFAGHGGWEEDCRHILGLTKMNWNNDSLYDRVPVTLSYAATLAAIARRIPDLVSRPYQFRYFM